MRTAGAWILGLIGAGLLLLGGFLVIGAATSMAQGGDYLGLDGPLLGVGIFMVIIAALMLFGAFSMGSRREDATGRSAPSSGSWICPGCGALQGPEVWQCPACRTWRPEGAAKGRA